MRYILFIAAFFCSSVAYGQGAWSPAATYNIWKGTKSDSIAIVPRDTIARNTALLSSTGQPVGDYGRIQAKNKLFYFHDSIRNRRVAFYDDITSIGVTPAQLHDSLNTLNLNRVMTTGSTANTTTRSLIIDDNTPGYGKLEFLSANTDYTRLRSENSGGSGFKPMLLATGGLMVSNRAGSPLVDDGTSALQVGGKGKFSDIVAGVPATASNHLVTRQQVTDSLIERISAIPTPSFQQVSDVGNTTTQPLYTTGNFIDISGISPFIGFNAATSSIRGLSGDLLNVVGSLRFFKIINGVGGMEMLAIDSNKATFNVLIDGITPPAGAINLEVPTAVWVRSRINDSIANQNMQLVTNKGNTTTHGINAMGFRSINPVGADGHSLANESNILRWLIRGVNAESGSDSGYDLVFNARSDAGGNIGDAVTVKRSNGFLGLGIGTPTSRLHIAGSVATAAAVITTTTTLDATHNNVDVNNSANIAVNLPAIASCPGREYTVSKASNNAFTVTITASGAETINGVNTNVLGAQYNSITIWNTGVEWRIK